MKGVLKFLSLTTATQLCLLINQLGLFPLQLRIWGPNTTAHWLVVVAVAALTSLGDFGLRNAGHSQLLASVRTEDPAAREEFLQVWALTRALLVGTTCLVLMWEPVQARLLDRTFEPWIWALTVALAFDMTIIVRGVWLDTLGQFNKVEAIFLCMIVVRILFSIIALAVFRASPGAIAFIMLVTSFVTLLVQARILDQPSSLALLAGGFGGLRWRSFAVLRFVVTDPAVNWMRLGLPVIVLASVATPRFTAIYVALRALFGLVRQVASQLSRYASVGYVQRITHDRAGAERLAAQSILLASLAGIAVSSVTIVDHGRLLRLWLGVNNPAAETLIGLTFAVGALTIGYQVNAGVLTRSGDLAGLAKRQYGYIAASGISAVIGLMFGSKATYLVLLMMVEVVIAGTFIATLGSRIARILIIAFSVALVLLATLAVVSYTNLGGVFSDNSPGAIMVSLSAAGLTILIALTVFVTIDRTDAPMVLRGAS